MYTPKFTLGNIPKKVRIGEITIRDGFQHEEKVVHTDGKMWFVDQAMRAGFKEIELTNFGNTRNIPQFQDNQEVVNQACKQRQRLVDKGVLKSTHDVEFTAVAVAKDRAYECIDAKKQGLGYVDRVLIMASTSQGHMRVNGGMPHKDYLNYSNKIIKDLRDNDFKVCGTVSTIWGCPVTQSATDLAWAVDLVEIFLRQGVSDIEHADHDGQANPVATYDYFARIMDKFPNPDLHLAHFHVTRGFGLANVYAAMQAGIDRFEATFGGIGGQPTNFINGGPVRGTGEAYYPNPEAVGLITMEDLLVMCNGMGVEHGINMDIAFKMGAMCEKVCGRRLRSSALHFGDLPKYGEINTYRDFDVEDWKKIYPMPRYEVPKVPAENWK